MMTDVQRRNAAKHFAEFWKNKGYEKGESQKFWLSLLGEVFGVEHPAEYISFEDQVHLDHTSFIDGYIPATRVLIEQKGLGKDLLKPIKQSDGSLLTPFQQAKRYITELPVDSHPKWVITCNFERFLVYDMNRPNGEPEEILLENLPTEYYRLSFLVDTGSAHLKKEMEISIQAGELVGKLYDAFLKQYKDPTNDRSLKSLNALCVRLVFCLYAEDAGIFGKRLMFHDYMRGRGLQNARQALIDLFRVLDTPISERDPYMDDDLAAFPYVNGGLFSDENIEIPRLNSEIYELLLAKASEDFDWSEISPTIFGAVFESTLNPETRRKGGMHYTSIESAKRLISDVPEIMIGSQPIDDGNYLFEKEEMEDFIKIEPASERYFHLWYGSREFINRSPRYCLYLGNCPPNELRKMPECRKRVEAVREFRLQSNRSSTRKAADSPAKFGMTSIPDSDYIVVPKVSSERRRYIPMGFMTPDILCSDLVFLIPDATLYHFGVLQSNVHMAWVRAVCGRLKSDYRYSKDIVYNNFPWPTPTPAQQAKIESTAQAILDARALYPDSSLADLYDDVTMPSELRTAHQRNDRAVMEAYGMPIKGTTESSCVAELIRRYQEQTSNNVV